MRQGLWTEQDDYRLKTLLAQGLTASAISREMGRTRNAVSGRKHRLGLSAAPVVRVERKMLARQRMSQAQQRRVNVDPPPGLGEHQHVRPTPDNGPLKPNNHMTVGRPIDLLSRCECRWPVNDAARGQKHLFCGAVTAADAPYCPHHQARTAREPNSFERDAAKPPKAKMRRAT